MSQRFKPRTNNKAAHLIIPKCFQKPLPHLLPMRSLRLRTRPLSWRPYFSGCPDRQQKIPARGIKTRAISSLLLEKKSTSEKNPAAD
jgi:hypothetical protein